MTVDDLKRALQAQFSDGLVTIVGLGLSAAHGLPTMGVLSRHLQHAIPPLLKEGTQADWDAVEHKLSAGEDLESALDAVPDGSDLITLIVEESASLMLTAETNAVQSVVSSGKKFPLSDLIHHLIHPGGRAEIITTNYDRLIEVAVEMAGFQIDCAFPSAYYSQLDEEASIQPFRGWVPAGTKFRSHNRSHVRLSKPHGSLDWFLVPTGPVRSVLHIAAPRLMITPGTSKYLKGYDVPFDLHRERANEAIDRAARFLVIGYGFNDHHLETHLRGRLAAGVPALVITKQLTESARRCVLAHPQVIALEESVDPVGTHMLTTDASEVFEGISIWSLPNFVNEVLT